MKKSFKRLCGLVFAYFFANASFAQVTLLDETFASNTQSLPTQMRWYSSSSASSNLLTDGSGKLTWNTSTGSTAALGYFTDASSPLTLASGETLSVALTFSAANITTIVNGFRFGLFNSGGSRVSADGTGIASTTFQGYAGYGYMTDLGYSSASESILLTRAAGSTAASQNLLGSGYPTGISGTSFAGLNLTSDTSHVLTYTVKNNGSSSTISFILDGTTIKSYTDSTNHYTTFDTISYQITANQASSVTINDYTVTYYAIPEPEHLFIFGFSGLFLFFSLRQLTLKKIKECL